MANVKGLLFVVAENHPRSYMKRNRTFYQEDEWDVLCSCAAQNHIGRKQDYLVCKVVSTHGEVSPGVKGFFIIHKHRNRWMPRTYYEVDDLDVAQREADRLSNVSDRAGEGFLVVQVVAELSRAEKAEKKKGRSKKIRMRRRNSIVWIADHERPG